MGLIIHDVDGKPMGYLTFPGECGKSFSRLKFFLLSVLSFLTLGNVAHHCGRVAKKMNREERWRSSTYKCVKCGLKFWTWTETG